MPLQIHHSRDEPPCGSASWVDRSRDLKQHIRADIIQTFKITASPVSAQTLNINQHACVYLDCFLHTETFVKLQPSVSECWSGDLPEPDLIRACALLKKKMAKSIRAPLAVCPSTRMCFSDRCHPLGRTISVACCKYAAQIVLHAARNSCSYHTLLALPSVERAKAKRSHEAVTGLRAC